jgi:hypothetical protein
MRGRGGGEVEIGSKVMTIGLGDVFVDVNGQYWSWNGTEWVLGES